MRRRAFGLGRCQIGSETHHAIWRKQSEERKREDGASRLLPHGAFGEQRKKRRQERREDKRERESQGSS